jgi:hypothetical protein
MAARVEAALSDAAALDGARARGGTLSARELLAFVRS